MTLVTVGCSGVASDEPENVVLPEEIAIPVIPDDSPLWFSDSLRRLTDDEKIQAVEIALNTPEASEQLEK